MVQAKRLQGRPRKTKQYDVGRVCDKDGCENIMSKYNDNKQCFQHAPMRQPRIRGREDPRTKV
tara:strand:- start:1933 stop:2121 length:189 start_codon:yes stop_codon:yes gene_type:complete